MNEFATAQALDFAKWLFGGLLAALAALVGIIRKHDLKQIDDLKASNLTQIEELKASIKWQQEHHVSKETLERVERSFRDAVDEMTQTRREMHAENQKGIADIKESVTGVHRRIDEEFRHFRNKNER